MTFKFEWNESKRRSNLRKHGLDFRDCIEVFDGLTVTIEDRKSDYGEERFTTVGLLEGRVVVISHTESNDNIRIISARKATKPERERFFRSLGNGLGSSGFAGRRRH